jgi:peptide/nickel transport system substrate-binding protein
MIRDPRVKGAAPLRSYFEHFDRIEVYGPYAFKLFWKKKVYISRDVVMGLFPLPRWLYGHAEDGAAYPKGEVAAHFDEHWYNGRAIGTGPFRFVEHAQGLELVLERNESYFQGRAALDSIRYHIIPDQVFQILKFQRGKLDIIELTPTQYQALVVNSPGSKFSAGIYQVRLQDRLGYRYIGWNSDSKLFSDKRVRQAMTHAFDRDRIIKEVFADLGTVITGNFYKDSPWYDRDLVARQFNLDKAGQLLDEAGWTDRGQGVRQKFFNGFWLDFEFELLAYGHSAEFQNAADIFKEDLAKIGVRVTVVPIAWPQMLGAMQGREFQAFTGGWGLDWEADPNQVWHSSQADVAGGSNFVGFRNPEADKIIEEAQSTFDFERRRDLFHRFHQIVYEEQPYTFFMASKRVIAIQPGVNNLTVQAPRPQRLYHLIWKQ